MEFWKCSECERDIPENVSKCVCGNIRPVQRQKGQFECAVVGCKNAGTTTDSVRGSNTWYCRNHFNSDPKVSGHLPVKPERSWQDILINERMQEDGMSRGPTETKSEYRKRCIRSIKRNIEKIEQKDVGYDPRKVIGDR